MYPWEGGLTGLTKSSPQVWKGHGDHAIQALSVSVDQIGLHLATMALLHKFFCILLHSGTIVAHLLYTPIQLLLSLVLFAFSCMHFF